MLYIGSTTSSAADVYLGASAPEGPALPGLLKFFLSDLAELILPYDPLLKFFLPPSPSTILILALGTVGAIFPGDLDLASRVLVAGLGESILVGFPLALP